MSWHWIGISLASASVIGAIIWPVMRVPELDLFPSGAERNKALRSARKAIFNLKDRLKIALPMPCLLIVNATLNKFGITFGKTFNFTIFIVLMIWFFVCIWQDKTAMRQAMRHQLAKHNRCVKCGYNLRGNESGCCPECGCEIESATA